MANLVIIESPTKATSLKSYLGSGYKVMYGICPNPPLQWTPNTILSPISSIYGEKES